jgi:hypothetical protein
MDSYMNDAAGVAFAAPAFVHVAITDLEVYGRGVTLRGCRGELRPQATWGGTKSPSRNPQGTSLLPTASNTFAAMDNVRILKSRIGSNAFSGTG